MPFPLQDASRRPEDSQIGVNIDANNIDAVTFDFYNTLVYHRHGRGRGRGRLLLEYLGAQGWQFDPWEYGVFYDIFENHTIDYTAEHSEEERRHYHAALAQNLFRRLNVRAPEGAAADHAENLWKVLGPASLAVFPDALDLLRILKIARYPLAVISNWPCGLRIFCAELGFGDTFDHVLASAEVGSAKPHPGIFHDACHRLGLPPHRVLHIGDSVADDVEGACAAGLPVVLVLRNDDVPPPDTLSVSSLEKLPELLGLNP